MKLTHRENLFLWGGRETEAASLAKEAGLTRSIPASHAKGYPIFFAQDAHSVLHLWNHADDVAQRVLAPYREQWLLSNAAKPPIGFEVPAPEFFEYMPFQLGGIYYAKDRENVLFGDAPGLGKTIEAIGLANLRGCMRVLVVCPANVRKQWDKQIRNWSTIPKVISYPVYKSSDGVHPLAHWVIVSYEVARDGLWDVLRKSRWDMVIIDEAHYLKTPDAGRTRAIFGAGKQSKCRYAGTRGLVERAAQVVALTGTPLPNRPRECFTLANALDPGAIDWMNFASFKGRFNPSGGNPMDGEGAWEYVARLPELNARLRCNFMVRRLKEDVLQDLPAKRYELVYAETTGKIAQAVYHEKLLDIDEKTMLNRAGGKIDGAISTVRKEMGEAMAPQVVEQVEMIFDEGVNKLVLFAWHHSVMDYLEKELADYGVVRIDGNDSASAKGRKVDLFRFDVTKRIILGQMQAIGTGTDGLQEVCERGLFAEPDWVFGNNEQCVDRLHRIGQAGSVLAQFMVAEGSFSERILGQAIKKGRVAHKVLDAAPVGEIEW